MKISTLRKHKGNPEIKDSRGFLSFNDSLLVFKKKKKSENEEFHARQTHTSGQRNMQGWCCLGDPRHKFLL